MANNSPKSSFRQKKTLAVIGKRFTKLNSKLQIAINGFEIEDIHSSRTEIKKLKAFLRLLRTNFRHPSKLKFPKKLNRIYKNLGHIRVLQLQQQNIRKLIMDMDVLIPATYYIINTEEAAYKVKTEELVKDIKSINKDTAIIKKHIPGKLTHVTIKKFVHTVLNVLQNLLSMEEIDDESIHHIRKLLKDLQYNWSYIKNAVNTGFTSWHLKKDKIRAISGVIGDFHDTCAALDLLDEELTIIAISLDERILLMNIRNKWHSDKDSLRQQIYKELKKLE